MDNGTLLENALLAATRSSADYVVVVTGANRSENEVVIHKFPVKIAFNNNWEKGIGSSIKCGLEWATANLKQLHAVIITVCDQPYLNKDVFNRLIGHYHKSGKKVVASAYNDSIGVPVLYDRSMFTDLMKIPDEEGAKKYILSSIENDLLEKVPFTKGEFDINDLNDFEKM